MRCPFCDTAETNVKDSRPVEGESVIRRRRECPDCGRRFTTVERYQQQPVLVVKRDGRKELFDREKLARSVMTALSKRPLDRAVITDMTGDIEQQLIDAGRMEAPSKEIGDRVLETLKEIDFIAYVRYASVYNEFTNADDFLALLKKQRTRRVA